MTNEKAHQESSFSSRLLHIYNGMDGATSTEVLAYDPVTSTSSGLMNKEFLTMRIDLRTESSYRRSVALASNSWQRAWLVLKGQIFYPLAQGFFWAVLKDWLAMGAVFARMKGTSTGEVFSKWLKRWISTGKPGKTLEPVIKVPLEYIGEV